jgi:N-acetylglucosaminyldiphosphoundecaprenol N-acetyl-beta-D-mannosaminyltransferase
MDRTETVQAHAVSAAPGIPPTATVLGVPLALTDYERTLDWIDDAVAGGHRGYLCVAATHTVMAAKDDPALRAAVLGADFTVPDGLAQLARLLRLRYPGLHIVGGHAPPFRELTDAEEEAVAADIRRSGADVVWVGIGVPKQEKWMARMRHRLTAPVLVGVGAAFDFHAGLIPQAPGWMQRAGLEWLFRLVHEPRRLWRRYLRYNPRFMAGFARQWARQRLR